MKNFTVEPIKVVIGGKNNVLKSISQKLVYCGEEYGKLVQIKNLINVTK